MTAVGASLIILSKSLHHFPCRRSGDMKMTCNFSKSGWPSATIGKSHYVIPHGHLFLRRIPACGVLNVDRTTHTSFCSEAEGSEDEEVVSLSNELLISSVAACSYHPSIARARESPTS